MPKPRQIPLSWQSKAILLIVVPWTVASTLLQAHWWATQVPVVAWTTLGISTLFGLIVWQLKAGTPAAAATGAAITANLMFASTRYPYQTSWLHGALLPILSVFLLAFAATKIGKGTKEKIGTGESKRGRNAAQVAANLGVAALTVQPMLTLTASLPGNNEWLALLPAFAALAEAAADTVSSEIGQVLGGQPRMITTLRKVAPGTDGAITLAGTVAGILAAAIVAAIGAWAIGGSTLPGKLLPFTLIAIAGVFGLLFDSLLGATLERKGWLNNDAVNFLSTLSAALFAVAEIVAIASITQV